MLNFLEIEFTVQFFRLFLYFGFLSHLIFQFYPFPIHYFCSIWRQAHVLRATSPKIKTDVLGGAVGKVREHAESSRNLRGRQTVVRTDTVNNELVVCRDREAREAEHDSLLQLIRQLVDWPEALLNENEQDFRCAILR